MKKSEHNLNVINNFILHYTHDNPEMGCDEMYQAAKDYIAEDHVDGEDMPQEDNVIYNAADMKKSFDAGKDFEGGEWGYEEFSRPQTNPDFGEWMGNNYNVKVD